jgi:hypothetical protein
MELKKFIVILFLINFNNFSNAQTIKPANNLTAFDVVKIQLKALQNNGKLKNDLGIKQVWIFAHPNNKKVTGPYERFRIMIYGKQYNYLLDHKSHKINLLMNTKEKYIYRIEILTKNKKLFYYEWQVEKGSDNNCNNCWFTTAVSIPIDQGNTI